MTWRNCRTEVKLTPSRVRRARIESQTTMALFGRGREPLLRRFPRLPGDVPSHDTFSRIFRPLEPDAFEAGFARYLKALAGQVAGASRSTAGPRGARSTGRTAGRPCT